MAKQEMTTVILVTHNERKELSLCLETVRRFAGEEKLAIVVVDKASDDGTAEWLSAQEDLAYATEEDGTKGYAELLNVAIELFQIDSDILLLQPEFTLTPGFITGMRAALYSEPDVGAVGAVANCRHYSTMRLEMENFQAAIKAAEERKEEKPRLEISLFAGAVLIRHDMRAAIGTFDERFRFADMCINDYCLRMNQQGFKRLCAMSAVAFCMKQEEYAKSFAQEPGRPADALLLTEKWRLNYFQMNLPNLHLIEMMKSGKDEPIQVLEVGCCCGATLLEIKNEFPNAGIYGFEINEAVAQIAGGFADVRVGNLEELNLPYEAKKFDYIIFGDVLEHLRNPAEVLGYCRGFLREGGRIIASIPNLMHISVVKDLLAGNFTYMGSGLLDRTHIHFFTYNEIVRMFIGCAYELEKMQIVGPGITEEEKEFIGKLQPLVPETPRYQFEAFQYVLSARKVKDERI